MDGIRQLFRFGFSFFGCTGFSVSIAKQESTMVRYPCLVGIVAIGDHIRVYVGWWFTVDTVYTNRLFGLYTINLLQYESNSL